MTKKPNGRANGSAHKSNGGSSANGAANPNSTTRDADPVPLGQSVAASAVQARDSSVAGAANSLAACAERDAHAEAATLARGKGKKKKKSEEPPLTPEEEHALAVKNGLGDTGKVVGDMLDPGVYVNALTGRVDLLRVAVRFLTNPDERIAQRAWERILDMKFGKVGPPADDSAPQVLFDLPRPER